MVSSSSSHLSPHDAVRSPKGCRSPFRSTSADGVEQPTTICDSSRHARTRGARLLCVPRCCAASCHVQLRCSVVISGRAGRLLCVRVAVHQGAKHAQARLTQLGGHRGGFHCSRELTKLPSPKIYCERRRHDEKRRKNRKEWKTLGGFRADS